MVAVLGLSFILSSAGCSEQDPVDYNDEVLGYYSKLDDQIAEFENAIWDDDYDLDDLQDEYDKAMEIYDDNYDALKAVKPLSNDPGFHAAVVAFYDEVKDALDGEYKDIMDIFNSDEDDVYDQISDLDDVASDNLIDAEDKVTDAQQDFADNYGITLY